MIDRLSTLYQEASTLVNVGSFLNLWVKDAEYPRREMFDRPLYPELSDALNDFKSFFGRFVLINSSTIDPDPSPATKKAKPDDSTAAGLIHSKYLPKVVGPFDEMSTYLNNKYTLDITTQMNSLSVTEWWKVNSIGSTLKKFAQKILGVPATSVASERGFSTAGQVITKYRTRLSNESIKALLCLKSWNTTDRLLTDTSTILDDIEI
jgi:hypothetical protein